MTVKNPFDKEYIDKAFFDRWGYANPDYSNGNGKSKKKSNNKTESQQEQQQKDPAVVIYQLHVLALRKQNPELDFEQWSTALIEKRKKFNDKLEKYFPDMKLLTDFELAIKTILNIDDINLPFMGVVFGAPSSMKTKLLKLLRMLPYSYPTDKFTARSFVSHSANMPKDKLSQVDMLPQIKDKILLTPELSALFTGKDDDIKEEFGIITRLLDGDGLETNSGVHGKRGYTGPHMFAWLGAAVDIPHNVYKFLSTIGFKIYFLRLPKIETNEDELIQHIESENTFNQKIEEIDKLLMDYLAWFEICPISVGQDNKCRIEWKKENDDKDSIRIIARLALLLAHIRGSIYVYRTSEHEELIPVSNNNNPATNNNNNIGEAYSHGVPIIEKPHRAMQQLYNLARGNALSYGRNYITREDLSLVIKVVLSTGSIERVLVLDLLIANKGRLTTSIITQSMNISNNAAKRTMTEFKGLELVTMDRLTDSSNSEHRISLKYKFKWFLEDEFAKLRDKFAVRKNTPEQVQENNNDDDDNITAMKLSEKGPLHFNKDG